MKSRLILLAMCLFGFQSIVNAEPAVLEQSLIGSSWSGEGHSGADRLLITYVFHFKQDSLHLEATCHADSLNGNLKSDLGSIYSNDGAVATLTSGVQANIPAGMSSCELYFPAGLEFQLENDQIYLELDGKRWPTEMKRLN